MRVCVLVGMTAVMLVLAAAGCGEGPLFHEDPRVLAEREKPADKGPVEDASALSEDERAYEPDFRRQMEEEKEEQEETEQEEEEREQAIQDSSEAINELSRLLNEEKLDEAKKMFDDNAHLIKQTAEDGMLDDSAKVAELYKKWWDAMREARQSLDREEVTPQKRCREGLQAVVAAGRFKQAAKQAKIYEH